MPSDKDVSQDDLDEQVDIKFSTTTSIRELADWVVSALRSTSRMVTFVKALDDLVDDVAFTENILEYFTDILEDDDDDEPDAG